MLSSRSPKPTITGRGLVNLFADQAKTAAAFPVEYIRQ